MGTLFAGRMATLTGNRAFLVCTPPAFAVFGGSFIHATQIAAGLPAAALLVQHAQPRHRTAAVIALLVLTVPWGWMISPAFLIAPLMPVAYLAWCCWNENLRATLLAGCAAAALALVFVKLALAPHAVVHVAAPGSTCISPRRLGVFLRRTRQRIRSRPGLPACRRGLRWQSCSPFSRSNRAFLQPRSAARYGIGPERSRRGATSVSDRSGDRLHSVADRLAVRR